MHTSIVRTSSVMDTAYPTCGYTASVVQSGMNTNPTLTAEQQIAELQKQVADLAERLRKANEWISAVACSMPNPPQF
jgi:uncharacterized protein YceH (UPF0502 family)